MPKPLGNLSQIADTALKPKPLERRQVSLNSWLHCSLWFLIRSFLKPILIINLAPELPITEEGEPFLGKPPFIVVFIIRTLSGEGGVE